MSSKSNLFVTMLSLNPFSWGVLFLIRYMPRPELRVSVPDAANDPCFCRVVSIEEWQHTHVV